MSTATVGKIDPGTEHDQAMEILNRAILGTREMIQKRVTPRTFSRFPRQLSEEELKKLPQLLVLLEEASTRATLHGLKKIPISLVCKSKPMLNRFKQAKLRTLSDMWKFKPQVLAGLLEQCEELGAKNELHMYLFVRH